MTPATRARPRVAITDAAHFVIVETTSQRIALAAEQVEHVVRAEVGAVRSALAPSWIAGLIAYRAHDVPLLAPPASGATARFVIVGSGEDWLALPATRVEELRTIDATTIAAPPAPSAPPAAESAAQPLAFDDRLARAARGVLSVDGVSCLVIDAHHLLTVAERAALHDWAAQHERASVDFRA